MRTENEDCWSYPEATEEVWGSVGNVIQEGKSQQRRFQGIGGGEENKLGEPVPDCREACSRNVTLPVR